MAGLIVVSSAAVLGGCGDEPATSAGGSDCAEVPTVSVADDPVAPPPPDQRAMMVAEGEAAVETRASDHTEDLEGRVSFVLYGDSEADDPFADRHLGVWYANDPEVLHATEGEIDDQRDAITVRGHEAFISRMTREPEVEMAWAECPDLGITLRSQSYTVDELVDMAEHLVVAEDGVVLEPGSVDGLDEVLTVPGVGRGVTAEVPAGVGSREVMYWGYPDVGNGSYTVETSTLGEEVEPDLLRLRWMFEHPGSRSTTVRGRDALVYEWPTSPDLTADEGFSVFWFETPTVAVSAGGGGLVGGGRLEDGTLDIQAMTEDRVLDFVEGLHLATPEEADALLRATRESQSSSTPPGSGDDPTAGVEPGPAD